MKIRLAPTVSVLAFSLGIIACSEVPFYKAIQDNHKDVRGAYYSATTQQQGGASYSDSPISTEGAMQIIREARWLKSPVPGRNAGQVPLQLIMDDLGRDTKVRMIWGQDVDPYIPVTGFQPAGTLKEALQWASSRTGYAFAINENDRTVTWSRYVTESFNVSYLGGSYDYQIGGAGSGGSGGGSDGGGEDAISGFANTESSYSSVTGAGIDVFSDIDNAVKEIVGEFGSVSVSRATGTAVVTATPATMGKVRGYFDAIDEVLSRQIMLDVKIVRFSGDESNRMGINWDLVQSTGNNILTFAGTSPTQNGLGTAPVMINYSNNSGSSALVEVLDEFGDISIVTQPRVVTQSNRVVELELGNITGYLGESKVTSVASSSDILPAVDLEAAYVEDGYFLFALAKVGNNGNVVLHIASRFQDLIEIVRKEAGASAIETPSVSRSKFVQTVVMRNGSTLVLNALRQEISESDSTSPISAHTLPMYKSGRTKIVETLVLVTPVVIDMG